jgi:hypothetical protein
MSDGVSENSLLKVSALLKILNFDLDSLCIYDCENIELDYNFDIEAEEFLRFAEKDLAQGDKHGLVNALSNAKRAIDSQVDKVLGCFGLLSRRNFPQKMAMLRDMGIIAPRIVNKVVKARNYLEHEYQAPMQEQVEDALDIARLFVISLDRFFPYCYELGGANEARGHDYLIVEDFDRTLPVWFDYRKPCFTLTGNVLDPISKEYKTIGEALVMSKEKGYLDLIKLAMYAKNAEYSNSDNLDAEAQAEASRLISLLSGNK